MLDIVKPDREGVCLRSKHTGVQTAGTACSYKQQERKSVITFDNFLESPVIGRTVTSDSNVGTVFNVSCLQPHCAA